MNILVTGAAGFVGRNLVENLKNIRDGKNNSRPEIKIDNIFEYDKNNKIEELDYFCKECDFVFNLAGVNRPKDSSDFKKGNYQFALTLLNSLKEHKNKAPIMLSSSIQASLTGRFGNSEYGISKLEGENLFFDYSKETGIEVFVYRFPNIVGKWVKPNYNSAVGTFCNNIANDLPITVNNPETKLEMLFIDDLVEEMFNLLEGHPNRANYPSNGEVIDGKKYDGLTPCFCENGRFCAAKITHKATLGQIVKLLYSFHNQPKNLIIPAIPNGSFEKKLYSMYLSYLPKDKIVFDLETKEDERGSFTELLKTADHGQFSVNVSKPGVTKGQHWHNSKWEFFIVVAGHGLIQERKVGSREIIEFEVDGSHPQAVHMLPGYVHNIINLSQTENLVTLMWANEIFNPQKPDTFSEKVKE